MAYAALETDAQAYNPPHWMENVSLRSERKVGCCAPLAVKMPAVVTTCARRSGMVAHGDWP
jgi:hypothetical protein